MNWKLIGTLSVLGIAMGVASLFGLTGRLEPVLWLVVFLVYAYYIAKAAPSKFFVHGLLVSVLNGLWIGVLHAVFSSTYFSHNPEMLEGYRKLPKVFPPRVMMIITGPLIGAASGVVAGLFAVLAARMMKRKPAEPPPA